MLDTFDDAALIAEPGTSKTTTLLQLAQTILQRIATIPCFVPLSEWATQPHALLESIVQRRAYRGATLRHLELLAEHGKLLIMLDGWNERMITPATAFAATYEKSAGTSPTSVFWLVHDSLMSICPSAGLGSS